MGAPMIDDVYNTKLLQLAGNIGNTGALDAPDATAKAHSKLCGSTVEVDIKMDGDVISQFAQRVKACALGQASAAVLGQGAVGATSDELRGARDALLKMLKEGGEPPKGRFADLQYLEPVKDYKARHASTMLAFDAIIEAIDAVERKRQDAA